MLILVTASPFVNLKLGRYGANERTVVERIQALRASGDDVTLLASERGDSDPTAFIKMKSLAKKLPNSRMDKVAWVLSPTAYSQLLLYSTVKLNQRWDVVINDGMPLDPLTSFLVASKLGLDRTINVLHGGLPLDSPWIRGSGPFVRRPIYGCQNLNLFSDMRRMGFRVVYFPTGVFFPPVESVCVEPDDHLIFVGRIAKHKAPHLAIRIAKRLDMPLKIVGPIGDREYFETRIRPQLDSERTYEGELGRKALLELVRTSRALVFTSQNNESQGLVLLEALSYGVPIIATPPLRHSGLYDILIEGENGIIIQPDSTFSRTVDDLFSINRRQIREAASARWDWHEVVRNYYRPAFEWITGDC